MYDDNVIAAFHDDQTTSVDIFPIDPSLTEALTPCLPNPKSLIRNRRACAQPQTPSTGHSSRCTPPGSRQRTLASVNVESIGNCYSRSTLESRGLVPVIILRDLFEVFCKQVRDAYVYDMKLKEAAESAADPWANCPVKFAKFAKNCSESASSPWRYLGSLWKAMGIPCLNPNSDLHSNQYSLSSLTLTYPGRCPILCLTVSDSEP